jgi:hypothetical protein
VGFQTAAFTLGSQRRNGIPNFGDSLSTYFGTAFLLIFHDKTWEQWIIKGATKVLMRDYARGVLFIAFSDGSTLEAVRPPADRVLSTSEDRNRSFVIIIFSIKRTHCSTLLSFVKTVQQRRSNESCSLGYISWRYVQTWDCLRCVASTDKFMKIFRLTRRADVHWISKSLGLLFRRHLWTLIDQLPTAK